LVLKNQKEVKSGNHTGKKLEKDLYTVNFICRKGKIKKVDLLGKKGII